MNKNKMKIVASMIAMLGASSSFAQNNVKANMETTATIESFCSINAGDINFGVVALPLTAQSANAQMNVLCSNNTPYTVDLSYGGQYVEKSTGTSDVTGITASMAYKYTDSYTAKTGNYLAGYRLYKDGVPIGNGQPYNSTSNSVFEYNLNGDNNMGDFGCNILAPNKIVFKTVEAGMLIQGTSYIADFVTDKHSLCDAATGQLNMTNFTKLFGGAEISDKGLMTGTFKGDQLAYQITLPNDSTKPWITKVNSYTATGTGSNQVIDMNAKIVPSSSSSTYIAADTYLDTVIATVSY